MIRCTCMHSVVVFFLMHALQLVCMFFCIWHVFKSLVHLYVTVDWLYDNCDISPTSQYNSDRQKMKDGHKVSNRDRKFQEKWSISILCVCVCVCVFERVHHSRSSTMVQLHHCKLHTSLTVNILQNTAFLAVSQRPWDGSMMQCFFSHKQWFHHKQQ